MDKNRNERVGLLRATLQVSQQDVASEIGAAPSTISNIETNKSNLTKKMAIRICEKYGANFEWLWNDKGEMFPNGTNPTKVKNGVGSVDPWKDEMYVQMKEQLSAKEKLLEFFKAQNEKLTNTLMNLSASKNFLKATDVAKVIRLKQPKRAMSA